MADSSTLTPRDGPTDDPTVDAAGDSTAVPTARSTVVSTPALDLPRLTRWLEATVDGFAGPVTAERIVGGNSNPIWRLQAASGAYVLRTQPAGSLLKSAHALDREVRVLRALGGHVPVAGVLAACDDLGITG